jgi:hypothetical protein
MPVKFQIAAQTGILISGKISFGVFKMERTPAIKINMARTMNVYGRRKANWTIHIGLLPHRMTGSPISAETQSRIMRVDQSVM